MSHPYVEFESDPLWLVVNDSIRELVENNDIHEQTAREYIVGYIVKHIRESGSYASESQSQANKSPG